MMHTDFKTGLLSGPDLATARKTVGDLLDYWQDRDAALAIADKPLYDTQTWLPRPDGTVGTVLWGNTILYPGKVGNEFFMTRGHWHVVRSHCELVITVSGKGLLVLMDEARNQWEEEMTPGSTHHIDGNFAHRTVNLGDEPLVFLCAWPADCGHEYDAVHDQGFARRYLG